MLGRWLSGGTCRVSLQSPESTTVGFFKYVTVKGRILNVTTYNKALNKETCLRYMTKRLIYIENVTVSVYVHITGLKPIKQRLMGCKTEACKFTTLKGCLPNNSKTPSGMLIRHPAHQTLPLQFTTEAKLQL